MPIPENGTKLHENKDETLEDDALEDLSEDGLAMLLRQLEEADAAATGLESRLDGLLDNLENMIEGLEGSKEDTGSNPVHDSLGQSSPKPKP